MQAAKEQNALALSGLSEAERAAFLQTMQAVIRTMRRTYS